MHKSSTLLGGASLGQLERNRPLEYSPTRSPELPPSLLPEEGLGNIHDVRGRIIGCEEAGEIVGIGRTQMWRDAKAGKLRAFVTGTENRPEYKFRVEDVLAYRERRNRKKELERLARERQQRRKLRGAQTTLRRALQILNALDRTP